MVSSSTQCLSQKPKNHPWFIFVTLSYPTKLYFLPLTCISNSCVAPHSLQVPSKPKPSSSLAYNHVPKWTGPFLPLQSHFKVLCHYPHNFPSIRFLPILQISLVLFHFKILLYFLMRIILILTSTYPISDSTLTSQTPPSILPSYHLLFLIMLLTFTL